MSKPIPKIYIGTNTTPKKTQTVTALTLMVIIIAGALLVNILNEPIRTGRDLSRVACVGDSITAISSYPSILQTFLGDSSKVGNFGVSGSTVSLSSVQPYLNQNTSQAVIAFQPTVLIILLGTNDARADVYPYVNSFAADYKVLIEQFQLIEEQPEIVLVIPPPVFENIHNISNSSLTNGVIPLVRQVAEETGLLLIDAYTPMQNHPDYFVDGVHPNNQGAKVIAETVYQAIS